MGVEAVNPVVAAREAVTTTSSTVCVAWAKAVESGAMLGTNLQHGAVEMAAGLAVAKLVAEKQPFEKSYTYNMPVITKDNVAPALKNVVTDKEAFLQRLPDLIDANVKSGDISNGSLVP